MRPSLVQRVSDLSEWPEADTTESHIRAERVRAIYQQAVPAQLLSVAAAAVVVWVLWSVQSHATLLVWLTSVVVVTGVRIGLTLAFKKQSPGPDRMIIWEKAFIVSLSAVSLVWGVGGWLIMPDSPLHEATVYFFLMGVAGGAVAVYSAHPAVATIAISVIMLPATLAFALSGLFELQAMALGGMLYLAAALRSTRSHGFFLRRTFQLSYELTGAYEWAREQAQTDDLTGLPNRRAFVEQAGAALNQALRYERPLSVAMLDIDHFKKINDMHGHAAGDAALRAFASVLRKAARETDTPGRLGGEEFAILLPETTADDAMHLAERLRKEVADIVITYDDLSFSLTCSIGVAGRNGDSDLDTLLRAADRAMYRAKTAGRDRVVG